MRLAVGPAEPPSRERPTVARSPRLGHSRQASSGHQRRRQHGAHPPASGGDRRHQPDQPVAARTGDQTALAAPRRLDDPHDPRVRRVGHDDPDPVDEPWTPAARDVDDDPQRLAQLGVHGIARHPGQGAEGLEPRRHLLGPVGVQRAHPTLVAGVERGEQLAHLGAAHLTDDEPVGPHPQRLPDEVDEGDPSDTLDVGPAPLQPHHVRMLGVELAHVLDDHDPLVGGALGHQRREHRRLARPRCRR